MPAANRVPIANSLLAALPGSDYRRMLTGLEPVALTYGKVLYEPGAPIRHVYFPNDALVSLLTIVEGHLALEVGLVGREGTIAVNQGAKLIRRRGHVYFTETSKLPSLSWATRSVGSMTVVQSSCSRMAGPSNVASKGSFSRA